jgi:hypothetical protein
MSGGGSCCPARSDHQAARAAAGSNGDVAAMIAAEVNEGETLADHRPSVIAPM